MNERPLWLILEDAFIILCIGSTLAGYPGLAGLDLGYGAIYRTHWTGVDFDTADWSLSDETG